MSGRASFLAAVTTLAVFASGPAAAPLAARSTPAGAVVETVEEGSAAALAGVLPDDLLLIWSRAAAPPARRPAPRGRIRSPWDVVEVEIEEWPRGPVTLEGRRGGRRMRWTMTRGTWGLAVRPRLDDDLLARHERARVVLAAGDPAAAAASWRAAAARAAAGGEVRLAAWLTWRASQALADAGAWPAADAAAAAALAGLERTGEPQAAGFVLRAWGITFDRRNDWPRAEDCFRRALAHAGGAAAENVAAARGLHLLARTVSRRGDLAAAESEYRRALALLERLAPESLELARTLNGLGVLALNRGDAAGADEHNRRALALQEKLAPGRAEIASSLNNLGIAAAIRGDLAAAEAFHRRALAIRERVVPGGADEAGSLNNLGYALMRRGDLTGAEDHLRRGLAIKQRLAPDTLEVATSLINLGFVATERRDLATAEDFLRRALALRERLAPDGLDVAASWNDLGVLADARGEFAAAEDAHRRALAIRERRAPASVAVAASLSNLGEAARERGDFAAARAHLERALAIFEQRAPASLEAAAVLNALGRVQRAEGNTAAATASFERALAIQQRLAPGSWAEARLLHDLGEARRAGGDAAGATPLLCDALDALEAQTARLGGRDEARSGFGVKAMDLYRACMDALLAQGDAAAAFHVLERSRARSFLALLAQRDLLLAAELPPELARERAEADAEHERLRAELARLDGGAAAVEPLRARLRDLDDRRAAIARRMREAAPRVAALVDPQPLDLAGAAAALDPGTVLLSYAVGRRRSVLFALEPGTPRLTVAEIAAGEADLRERVRAFRNLIERRDPADLPALLAHGRALYDLLVRPAEEAIARGERLLLSPDGPLHALPFAALVRAEGGDGAAGSYLAAWRPLHVATSVTVYAELRKAARRERDGQPPQALVAFGDPAYAAGLAGGRAAPADPELRSLAARGARFTPLPSTRREVETLTALFADRAQAFLGADASEGRARAAAPGARYLHFACHGYLDEQFPLDSALALAAPEGAAPGRDNGLLQAWEVFEQVRLDAELVTLSACDTALGKEMGGEGLLGLTRAFQYAGARAVLASLWAVSDDSTADLMAGFYRHLRAGAAKDEALRAAQRELLAAHPFHWAAFELFGDPR